MSFFDDLLSNFLISSSISGPSSGRSRLPYLLLGFFGILLSGVLLFLYLYVYVPATAEKYQVLSINYSRCYLEGERGGRRVVLESEGRKYKVNYSIWPAGHGEDEIQKALCQSSSGKVWLESGEDTLVRGVETHTFSIDPSVGAAWDASNRQALLWLAGGFFTLSAVLIVAVSVSRSYA